MTPAAPSTPRTVRLARALAALAVAAALVAGLVPAAGAVEAAAPATDAGVGEASTALRDAEATLARTQEALDATAEAFERAQAHHERLAGELAAAEERAAEAATARAEDADVAAAAAAVEAYRNGVQPTSVAESALRAGDLPTALHHAGLVERLTVRGAAAAVRERERARDAAARAEELGVIVAGVREAVAARQASADALTAAVADARRDVDEATAELADARRVAAERAEAAATARNASATQGGEPTDSTRRTAAADSAGALAGAPAGAGDGLVLDGKTCPVAMPNGFIDSWGFPRSGGRTHKGVDMFAAYGAPIRAVEDGTVRVSTNRLGGLSINLSGASGDRYYYAHLSSTAVESGQQVRVGDVIGANGDSGNAKGTSPHLHWQVHPGGGDAVNPYPLAHSLCRGHGRGV